jgi:flavin-dependent dehydrogenase
LVVGAGAAGLTLVRQLRRAVPALSVALVERRPLPTPPEALKLGESTSEAAAGYLERLGLGPHLADSHAPKLGLRYFFAQGNGQTMADRAEFASMHPSLGVWSLPFTGSRPSTWQLHRGRLEHFLAVEAQADGVELLDACELVSVSVSAPHRLVVRRGGLEHELAARWLVDASGREQALHGLTGAPRPWPHTVRATWTWVDGIVDPDALSDHPAFEARCPYGIRRHSTTHLVGPGRWVWLIGLASGHTSVGLVEDPDRCPSAPAPTPAGFQGWLDAHEPDCGRLVRELGGPLDVHAGTYAAYRTSRLVDATRIAVTGDAAGFIDPMYSSGLDFVAYANDQITAAVQADLAGADLARQCRYGSVLFERLFTHHGGVYANLYPLTDDPPLLCAKIAWDNAVYFAFTALWSRSGEQGDPASLRRLSDLSERVSRLQGRVQGLLSAWHRSRRPGPTTGVFDQSQARFLLDPQESLAEPPTGELLRTVMARNVEGLERLAAAYFERAAAPLRPPPAPWNPYAIGLDPEAWQREGLRRGRARVHPATADAEQVWLRPQQPAAAEAPG